MSDGLAKTHLAAAKDAAAELDQFLSAYGHRVRVYGKPPTISLQLSLMAAHHLLDAVDILQKFAAADPCPDDEYDADAGPCVYCGAEPVGIDRSPDGLGGQDGRIPALVEDHDPSCPWRRARELMGEQGSE